jgi:hypothetical protein
MRDNADLLLYGSSLYRRRDVVLSGAVVARKTLPDGSALTCVAGTSLTDVVVRKRASVVRTVSLTPGLVAQPAPGAYVGTATYRADGESLGVVDLYATSLPATMPGLGVTMASGVTVAGR